MALNSLDGGHPVAPSLRQTHGDGAAEPEENLAIEAQAFIALKKSLVGLMFPDVSWCLTVYEYVLIALISFYHPFWTRFDDLNNSASTFLLPCHGLSALGNQVPQVLDLGMNEDDCDADDPVGRSDGRELLASCSRWCHKILADGNSRKISIKNLQIYYLTVSCLACSACSFSECPQLWTTDVFLQTQNSKAWWCS